MKKIAIILAVTFVLIAYPGDSYPSEKLNDLSSNLKGIKLGSATVNFGGSLRTRYEYLHNYNKKSYGMDKKGTNPWGHDKDDGFFMERLRLNMDAMWSDRYRFFVEFQDANIWDYDLPDRAFPSNPYEDDTELQRAFIEIKNIVDSLLTFKLGRQTIAYGDWRIFGPGAWSNTQKWLWDAAKLRYKTKKMMADLFYGRNVIHYPHQFNLNHRHDKEVVGLYISTKFIPNLLIEPFYVYQKDNDLDTTKVENKKGGKDDLKSHSIGMRVAGKIKPIDYGATYARQFGDWGDDDIKAWALNAYMGYTLSIPWSPRVSIDYNYASGDDDPKDGDHETFDGLFGAGHKYYGRMDLFKWQNLENCQFQIEAKPIKKLKAIVAYNYLRLAESEDAWYGVKRRDKSGNSGRELGHEIDLTLKYSFCKMIKVEGGYSHFFPGDFVKNTGDHDDADWCYLQLLFSI